MGEEERLRLNDNEGLKERKSISWILFDIDGPVISALTKAGELLILSIVFVLCCLPVVTIGPACTALYGTVVKNIRRSRGYPLKEFFSIMKKRFRQSFIAGLIMILMGIGLYYLYGLAAKTALNSFWQKSFVIFLTIVIAVFFYLFPVLSRFKVNIRNAFSLAFLMCGEHLLTTLAHIVAAALLVYLFIFIVPIICIPFVPGIWTLLSSFLMERILRKYMPPPSEEDRGKWYYEK
ncbi:MAG: DUF624 domain-containing protein [Eubacterium sp.]|nr:DUF624 domain-containing protein [Eubacterium sp.]